MSSSSEPFARGLKAVALVEAAKAAVVLLAGFGLLALIHHDVEGLAARIVSRLHLNPAKKYPHIFLDAAAKVTDSWLWLLAGAAFAYAACRAAEAYGLWRSRAWAEWFGALTGAIYVPFEIYELVRDPTWIAVSALIVNVAVVALLACALWRRQPPRSMGAG